MKNIKYDKNRYEKHIARLRKNKRFVAALETEKMLIDIAVKLAKARERKKLTQKQLADRIHVPQQEISKNVLRSKIGREITVLVDDIDAENEEAVARSPWDAPEIDGNVFIPGAVDLKPGDMVKVRITDAEEYDLVAERI